jgi:acetyl-CoA decarbonylase/synthase complex subunit gamma
MNYTVDPGLYAAGSPDDKAPVVVTANYKLSFDELRRAIPGRNAWILVLDTDGINVWCAAGKGTFSTDEVVARIASSELDKVVSHRRVIVPQLGAPGVAAHEVKSRSGFKVVYGPIRAKDLPAFLDNGMKATPEMRNKTFGLWERLVLIPVELVDAVKYAALISVVFLFAAGFGGPQSYWANVSQHGLRAVWAIVGGVFAGAILTPILLPWLPGRAFASKGIGAGLLVSIFMLASGYLSFAGWSNRLETVAWFFLITAISAYLGMNFTGASTYTSLSGVKREMTWAVPAEIAGAAVGLILWSVSRFGA